MNAFQNKMLTRALTNADRLDIEDQIFIRSLNGKSDNYQLTKRQNHWLILINNRVMF